MPTKTDLDDQLRILWAVEPALEKGAMCAALGIHSSRLQRMVTRLGLPARVPAAPKVSTGQPSRGAVGVTAAAAARRDLMISIWKTDPPLPWAEIAERLGVKIDSARALAKRLGLRREPVARREPIVKRDFAFDFRRPKISTVARDNDSERDAVAHFIATRGVTRAAGVIDVDAIMNAVRRTGREVVPRRQGEYREFLVDGRREDARGVRYDRAGLLALANRCRAGLPPWAMRDVTWKRVADQAALRKHIATKPRQFQRGMVETAVREGRLDAAD